MSIEEEDGRDMMMLLLYFTFCVLSLVPSSITVRAASAAFYARLQHDLRIGYDKEIPPFKDGDENDSIEVNFRKIACTH